MIYYEVKPTYVKVAGDGKMKSTKEVYLVRALNYADAESRMVETLSHYSHEGMPEVEIKKVKYVDIFDSEIVTDDKFYKAKVVYTSLEGEGDNLKEKKVSVLMLVRAANIKGALQRLEKNLSGTASDYFIHTISETLIMDEYGWSVADVAAEPAEV